MYDQISELFGEMIFSVVNQKKKQYCMDFMDFEEVKSGVSLS
jgi:hypothetical protein